MSVIQKFFALNAKEKRYKDFPRAKFSPSSITLSEDGLCHLLYGNSTSENILGVVMKLHEAEIRRCPTSAPAEALVARPSTSTLRSPSTILASWFARSLELALMRMYF